MIYTGYAAIEWLCGNLVDSENNGRFSRKVTGAGYYQTRFGLFPLNLAAGANQTDLPDEQETGGSLIDSPDASE